VITAGARPNPSISATPEYTVNPASGMTPWIATIQLDMPIETAGKRRHRITRAEQLSEALFLELASSAWKVRSEVRSSLIDWTSAQRAVELLQHQQEFQSNVVAALEKRLAAGAVANTDVTLARLALSKTLVSAGEAKARSAEARVRLAQALGLPLSALEGVGVRFDLAATLAGAERFTSAEMRKEALHGRADVLAGLAEYAASEAALRLEIARQYPDVHLSPGYQYDQGENKWALGLSVELPVLNQNQGPIAEANAHRAEAAARFTALQARIIGELDAAVSAFSAAREQLANTATFIANQAAQYRAVEQQVRAGEADPLDATYAELERLAGESAKLDALTRLQRAVGQLEDAVQQPLDTANDRPIDLSRNPRPNP
jgi:cobalt-zinc-cadmium efflux system outer membrane protein